MSRTYMVSASNTTVAGATTLVAIRPPANRALRILRMAVTQHANATSAQNFLRWGRKAAVLGTYAAATPARLRGSDPVSVIVAGGAGAAGTVGLNATAEGAGVVTPICDGEAFNSLSGFLWLPSADDQIELEGGSDLFVLQFGAAPGTLTGWDFALTYKEIG